MLRDDATGKAQCSAAKSYFLSLSAHSTSAPLAASEPHHLPVLLQLRDELITLLDDVVVLPVLVVRPVRLDDAVHAVDSAGDAVCCDEVFEIPRCALGQLEIPPKGERRKGMLTCPRNRQSPRSRSPCS